MAKETPPTPPSSSNPRVQGSGKSEQLARLRQAEKKVHQEIANDELDQTLPRGAKALRKEMQEQALAEIRQQVELANAKAAEKYGKSDQAAPGGLERDFIHFCLQANDLGMGELYAELNKDRVLRNVTAGEVLVWAGHYWQPDLEGKHLALVERVSAVLLDELSRVHSGIEQAIRAGAKDQAGQLDHMRKIITKRVDRLRTPKGRAACVEFAFTLADPEELE